MPIQPMKTRFLPSLGALVFLAGAAGAQSFTPQAPAFQAVSPLGDTLRVFPMSADTRARYERQLGEAQAAYLRSPANADSVIWYARRLGYLGRIREAIDVYTRGIASHPDNPWMYRHRGHRYISIRDFDRAIADLEKAQSLVAGKPDIVEEDGQPNARNTPIGTLHSNIAYHLGLAHYLKGDFARAIPIYRQEMATAKNDDRIVSTAHWLYMSLRRLGRDQEAAATLAPIGRTMNVIENDTYHRLLLLYKGVLPPDSVLAVAPDGQMSVTDATAAYGIANWHLYNGRRADAERLFRRILDGGQWGSFGYIAAEAELASMRRGSPGMQQITTYRPFGTLREQAALQQQWLEKRMTTVLPALMRKHGVETWVVPMREYNEDPVFSSIVSPTTFAARRRTIYIFHDPCGPGGAPGCTKPIERLALGGTSQGGVFTAVRSTKPAAGPAGGTAQQNAELWGDEQWQVLVQEIEKRNPRTISINTSRVFAFNDGLSAGELEGMREALGPKWAPRLKPADDLALDLIASRLPEEAEMFQRMTRLVWGIIDTAFSSNVITPGVTRTEDVVWWMRQKVNDLGLGTWFQPSVSVQRRGVTDAELGANPIIMKGDVLHCDFGITAMRLNTDTQHMGYVLRDGESDAPAGLKQALLNSNRLQDIVVAELRAGRTGNEILTSSLARMKAAGIEGTVYSHPVGVHGHGAGPLIGLWDYQDGVPGRGDARVIPNMWYSIELQATTPVPEWNGQRVRSAQEEDVAIGADGVPRWALGRQTSFHLVRPGGVR
ncbi:MAG TPA: tetratricopeptide repeat protein [Gemmatimonadaceae bacterium]|nr:tetratricopeptide repeat protein [Gemmatimonadaceae bacterium]